MFFEIRRLVVVVKVKVFPIQSRKEPYNRYYLTDSAARTKGNTLLATERADLPFSSKDMTWCAKVPKLICEGFCCCRGEVLLGGDWG